MFGDCVGKTKGAAASKASRAAVRVGEDGEWCGEAEWSIWSEGMGCSGGKRSTRARRRRESKEGEGGEVGGGSKGVVV